jgi:PAS domain S-box-containing protein
MFRAKGEHGVTENTDGEGLVQKVEALEREARERRRVEEALRESEIRLKTVLDTVQAGIVVVDPETLLIVGVNAAAGRMIGAPREQILGSDCHRYICPDLQSDCPVAGLEQGIENVEHVLFTHRGGKVPVLKTVVPVILAGRQHLLESFIDITDRKQAEEELQRINKELNNFVDVVSHDLKNPIMSIQGFCFLLSEQFGEQLGEKGRRYVQQLQSSAEQMERLVLDLLELSRAGRIVSTFEDVSAQAIVQTVVQSLEDRMNAKGIELFIKEDLPTVYCDAGRLRQVFENLLCNAVKFVGEAQRPVIEIGCKDVEGAHQFYVRDNGVGIVPENHRKIFEMFSRLEETGEREGTGLGLAIVERIVQSHGGKVWVESEKGLGAKFCFTLPKQAGDEGSM